MKKLQQVNFFLLVFFINKGEVTLYDSINVSQQICTLRKGRLFGHAEFFNNCSHRMTFARATKKTEFFYLDNEIASKIFKKFEGQDTDKFEKDSKKLYKMILDRQFNSEEQMKKDMLQKKEIEDDLDAKNQAFNNERRNSLAPMVKSKPRLSRLVEDDQESHDSTDRVVGNVVVTSKSTQTVNLVL